jgi:hypothetical protein
LLAMLCHVDQRHRMHATPPSPPWGMQRQPRVERTLPPAHAGCCHLHREDCNAIVPRASSELPTPPDNRDTTTPPLPRDVPLLKRSPRLRVTDHHDADQPSTTTEDATCAMDPSALAMGENGPCPCATDREDNQIRPPQALRVA